MHLYALIHMQKGVLIIVTSLLETSFQFSYLFFTFHIPMWLHVHVCIWYCCDV